MIIFRQRLSILGLPLLFVLFALGAMQSATAHGATSVIYVDVDASGSGSGVDWANACNTISAGLIASTSGDEIRVAEGTYSEAITLKSGVALYGGFAATETLRVERNWTTNETIIDATGLNSSAVRGANFATLDGFTVTGGNVNSGGGVYCTYSSPTLTNCTITGNSATENGGGVYCLYSSPTLTNCKITGNSGGGVHFSQSDPTLTNCTITGNSAEAERDGGGVYCTYSSPTLTNCTIKGNLATGDPDSGGGGVYCRSSSPTLTNCTITGNSAAGDGGGVYCWKSSPTLTNCTITGNKASSGGGLYCWDSSPTLMNCTIAGNSASLDGGGVFCSGSSTLTNCILWNQGTEIVGSSAEDAGVTYSCVQGGWGGTGNIDAYPQFVDAESGDYNLKNSSPCVDRGLVSAAPSTDKDGQPRPGGDGLVDMGAYESPDTYLPGPASHTSLILRVRSEAPEGGDGSSWEDAFSTISAALQVCSVSDEVWVAGGRYGESIVLEATAALYGGFAATEILRVERDWTANETIIDAIGLTSSAVRVANFATLDGFTVTGGNATFGGGVCCFESSLTLTNCTITGNDASYGGGVYCWYSSPTLTNCTITGNSAYEEGGGVYCSYSDPTLTNCTITGNSAELYGGGVYCLYGSPTLTNCILWNRGTEIAGSSAENAGVTHSCVQGGWEGTGNIDASPKFMDEESGDYHFENGSPCVDRGLVSAAPSTDKDGQPRPGGDGLVDMGAYESPDSYLPGPASHTARILRVRSEAPEGGDGSSWENAFSTISAALEVCCVSDEVWVAGGSYGESIALEPTAALYGGFAATETLRVERNWSANETIIDATGLNSSAVRGANFATLDGFTVTGGNATFGGGVYCYNTSPTLKNCTITGNDATATYASGGGVYCLYSSPTLRNCTITGNSAANGGGGVYCYYYSDPTLTNCTITGNSPSGEGGGVYCYWYSSPTLTNCILWNPYGEIALGSESSASVTYSCVEGGYTGTGNISSDPSFVHPWDGETADLHLLADSPCIDSGITVASVTTDIEGNPRPNGAGYEMGAYEYYAGYETPTPTNTPSITPTETPTVTNTIVIPTTLSDVERPMWDIYE